MKAANTHARTPLEDTRFVVVAGTNRKALEIARSLEGDPDVSYRVVGFVDDPWDGIGAVRDNGYSLIGSVDDFTEFVRTEVVDEVIVSLPLRSSYDNVTRIMKTCEEQGIPVRLGLNLFDLTNGNLFVDRMGRHQVLTVHTGAIRGRRLVVKRALDLVLATLATALLLPLLLVVSLLIVATSRGPVFYVQDRIGLNKRPFRMYKFRTMCCKADEMQAELEELNEMDGAAFKIKNDPRVTRIGGFLRRTSIDELPQLFNVLRGDISLVGPRPLPVRDFERFDQDWHRRRFSVRPGITCLWQVNGRNTVPFDKWMMLDLEYIDRWSLWLDVKILAKTIPAVVRGAGAA